MGRFSKDLVTYRARKAIFETMIRLPWKAALLTCFRYKEMQNNCQVSKLETCSYWRCKGISITRKVSGRSRNGPLKWEMRLAKSKNYIVQSYLRVGHLSFIQTGWFLICELTPSAYIQSGTLQGRRRLEGAYNCTISLSRRFRRPIYFQNEFLWNETPVGVPRPITRN